ncbi:MAG: acyl--CoA ligase [Rhodospirillaceae bacterium]|jgi:cyclohexanecarboxylate-CoA ligase|nr:acyl--CoA ligase [Rhodospirillaceae bacterium]
MILCRQDEISRYTTSGAWDEATLDDVFRRNVRATPDRQAVLDAPNRADITSGPSLRLSYRELDDEVDALAGALRTAGVGLDDIIVVQLPNIADLVALYLAIARLGAVISPVPVQHGPHEMDFVLGHLRPRLFVTTDHFKGHDLAAQAQAAAAKHSCPIFTYRAAAGPHIDGCLDALKVSGGIERSKATANDILTICWTSGTESTPKAVPRSHNNWFAISRGKQALPGERFLSAFPLVNMGSIGGIFFPWLLSGGSLALHHPFDVQVFLGQIEAEGINYSSAPPTILQRLLDNADLLEATDLSTLRALGSGAAPIPPHLVAEFRDRFGVEVINTYASNEGAILVSGPEDFADPVKRVSYFPRLGIAGLDWATPVAAYVETRLVDLESEQDIQNRGVVGELRFRGPTVFPGYFEQPDLTENAFDSEGYYRTGDLFEFTGEGEPAPFYRFISRVKEIIVRGGMKISPAELEAALGACPGVQDIAVVGRPDKEMGERVVAVAVSQQTPLLTRDSLIAFLKREGFASYKIPEFLVLCAEIPRNPVGKIVREEVRLMANSAART